MKLLFYSFIFTTLASGVFNQNSCLNQKKQRQKLLYVASCLWLVSGWTAGLVVSLIKKFLDRRVISKSIDWLA